MKRIKFPNGFGSITKRTDGNRRNPYIVRKTIQGKQKIIGSFSCYAEAIAFLVDYNKNPHIYSLCQITFSELYHLMSAERYPKLAKSTSNNSKPRLNTAPTLPISASLICASVTCRK